MSSACDHVPSPSSSVLVSPQSSAHVLYKDLIQVILTYLQLKELAEATSLSKLWYSAIRSSKCLQLHPPDFLDHVTVEQLRSSALAKHIVAVINDSNYDRLEALFPKLQCLPSLTEFSSSPLWTGKQHRSNLSDNSSSSESYPFVGHFPDSLISLDLTMTCAFARESLNTYLSNLVHLEHLHLNLRLCWVPDICPDGMNFDVIGSLKKLKFLTLLIDLAARYVSDECIELTKSSIFRAASSLPNLQELELSGVSEVTNEGHLQLLVPTRDASTSSTASSLPSPVISPLVYLGMSASVSTAGWTILHTHFLNLTYLPLTFEDLHPSECIHLSQFHSLKALTLHFQSLSEGLDPNEASSWLLHGLLPSANKLESLALTLSYITCNDLGKFLRTCTHLESIYLTDCRYVDSLSCLLPPSDSLSADSRGEHALYTTLSKLSLNDCRKIPLKDLQVLRAFTNLQELSMVNSFDEKAPFNSDRAYDLISADWCPPSLQRTYYRYAEQTD